MALNNEVKFKQGLSENLTQALVTANTDTVFASTDKPVFGIGGQLYYGQPTIQYKDNKITLWGIKGDTENTVNLGEIDLTLDGWLEGATYVADTAATSVTINGKTIEFSEEDKAKLPALVMLFHNEQSSGDTHSIVIIPASAFLGKNLITAGTFNGVDATFTTGDGGKTIVFAVNGADILVGTDEYEEVTYPEPFSTKTGVANVAETDTLDGAINKVEKSVKVLVDEVLANEATTAEAVKALGQAAGTINDDDEIAYVKNTDAKYIAEATSLADADNKLDAAIKNIAITAGTISGTHILTTGDNASKVEIADNTITITANVDLPDPVSYEGKDAITIEDSTAEGKTNTKEVALKIHADNAEDNKKTGVELTQSTDGLKAELNLDNTAAQEPAEGAKATGGIGLAVDTTSGDIKATLYWGEF